MKKIASLLLALVLAAAAQAKLPAPSEDAKAKAAEAAAKAAHGGKVEGYKLCLAMDRAAANYYAQAKKNGREAKPPAATPACADPGPFVPAVAAAAASPVAGAAAPTAVPPVAAAAAPKKP